MDFLKYEPAAVFECHPHGISQAELASLSGSLEDARRESLADLDRVASAEAIPKEKQPLDARFIDLSDRLLAAYRNHDPTSEVAAIIHRAKRLADTVDRVVVLGIGGSYMGARALLEACCHPYHNELTRGERRRRKLGELSEEARARVVAEPPRIYFEGNNVDDHASRGLFDLLGRDGTRSSRDQRWAIVVISKSGTTLETAVAFQQFVDLLERTSGGDVPLSELIVPVTGTSGALYDSAKQLGVSEQDLFEVPDGVGGRFSVLSAVGLLPAALMGLDIVELLEGAEEMNAHFHAAPAAENVVLKYVGVCHLLERERGANLRILSCWSKALEAAGLWYDQLLSESLGKNGQGATPITCVNTRDLHSRGQQHQEGRRDKLITNLIVNQWSREPSTIPHKPWGPEIVNKLAGRALPDVMDAAVLGTNQAYADDNRPTADLRLPDLSERSLGQLFQMLMLATVVEGRLTGINPYGQPGVEAYKRNMKRLLELD